MGLGLGLGLGLGGLELTLSFSLAIVCSLDLLAGEGQATDRLVELHHLLRGDPTRLGPGVTRPKQRVENQLTCGFFGVGARMIFTSLRRLSSVRAYPGMLHQ